MSKQRHGSVAIYLVAWLVLLILLGVSAGSAWLDIGIFHPVVNFGVAATQAAIVFIVFMRLGSAPALNWVFAAAGFFWLIFLFGLGTVDYVSRTGFPSH